MHPPDPPSPGERDAVAEIVERCVLAYDQGGDAAMRAVLSAHPTLASAAEAQLEILSQSGLLPPPDADPERIGPYRILQRLGYGGMGTVYLAEQDPPLRRKVALKVIKKGMDTREVLARFAIERQALALLDHANVARVLDAGSTADGRPYLCMDYVHGQPITQYCDERGFDVRQRIELFAQVCDAVQAAHQRGILHRDLKPSNILVGDRDGKPWPTVIDFGMAKSLGPRLADVSMHTTQGQVVGTPEYMSPEQAANELDVDTRTDVFSLGVVLYELLTGALPIDSLRLRSSQPEMLRAMQEEPPTPSTRISRLGARASDLANRRRTDPQSLLRHLRGDIDWVVMRALEKDRNRRYGMAADLAMDLRRHLQGEPVMAGPPTAWYRWAKFVGRHRLQVGAAAAVFLALLAGLATSIVFYQEAEAKAAASAQSLDIALQAVERMVQAGEDHLDVVPRMEGVRRQLLEEALELHRRLASANGGERLQLRTVRALAGLANVQAQLGDRNKAIGSAQQARQMLAALPASQRDHNEARCLQADLAYSLALWSEDLGQSQQQTAQLLFESKQQIEAVLAAGDPDPATRNLAVKILTRVAFDLRGTDAGAARACFLRVQTLIQPILADPMGNQDDLPAMLSAAARHCEFLLEVGEPGTARDLTDKIRAVIDRVFAATDDLIQRARYLPVLGSLGPVRFRTEQFEQSIADLDLTIALRRQLASDFPAVESHSMGLGVALANRAVVEQPLGRLDAANRDLSEAMSTFQRLLAAHPGTATYRSSLLQTAVNLAHMVSHRASLGAQVDWSTAERALQIASEAIAAASPEALSQRAVAEMIAEFHRVSGQVHQGRGRRNEAIAAQRLALQHYAALVQQYPDAVLLGSRLVDVQEVLARSLLQAGNTAEAATLVAAAVQLHAQLTPKLGNSQHLGETRRELLELQLRIAIARGQLRDIDASLDAILATSPDPDHDIIGHTLAANLALAAAKAAAADTAERRQLLQRVRTEVAASIECAERFARSPATMLAVQRANTWRTLVQCEQVAGDAAAAAATQQKVVDGYEAAWRERENDRNRGRLAAALQLWYHLAMQAGDFAQAERAAERALAAFPRQADELVATALAFGALATALPAGEHADACAGRGVTALAAAVDAGFVDGKRLDDPRAAPLKRQPTFATVAERLRR